MGTGPIQWYAMIQQPNRMTKYAATGTVAEIVENDDAPDECIIFRHFSETDEGETVWVSAQGDSFVPLDEVQ